MFGVLWVRWARWPPSGGEWAGGTTRPMPMKPALTYGLAELLDIARATSRWLLGYAVGLCARVCCVFGPACGRPPARTQAQKLSPRPRAPQLGPCGGGGAKKLAFDLSLRRGGRPKDCRPAWTAQITRCHTDRACRNSFTDLALRLPPRNLVFALSRLWSPNERMSRLGVC